jgi:hypothetical protein
LLKVIDAEDNINVVVDSLHTTEKVTKVLESFGHAITVYKRPFDSFYENSMFHSKTATGDYVFGIDADEMPQEALIKNLKNILKESDVDILWIPRINIHPGITDEFINKHTIPINECGWINWPDYQGRIHRISDDICWTNELHTKLTGAKRVVRLNPIPALALWHIKSIEKQESRWSNDEMHPPGETLYELLM